MQYERTSGLGLQFTQPGVPRDWWAVDPITTSDENVVVTARTAVMGVVAFVLYRRAPELEVFLVEHRNTAITGWWLPSNDMRPGGIFEEDVHRTCKRYYGFAPGGNEFGKVSFFSVITSAMARFKQPCHMLGPVLAYCMTEQDQRLLRPGQTADGEPSPLDFCVASKWVSPYAVLDNPAAYNALLVGVLGDFVGVFN